MEPHEDHPDLIRFAAEGRVVAYFGFGSLVNRNTLRTSFLGIRRASVQGWRRLWVPRSADAAMAMLSVTRAAGRELQGVVVYDLAENLPLVDEREAGYDRRDVDADSLSIERSPIEDVVVHIYEGRSGPHDRLGVDERAPILQSYLDAVMQGYRLLYGDDGVRRFVEETGNFETPVLKDRHDPRYPRPITLSDGEAELFDGLITERGGRFIEAF